jgi:transcriptional regulator of acetoin/glycerol metabolism
LAETSHTVNKKSREEERTLYRSWKECASKILLQSSEELEPKFLSTTNKAREVQRRENERINRK